MAGVGGGSIVTPLCMVFYGFLTKDAVAVSAFATFAATMGSFITSFKNRHPEKKSVVLLDYALTNLMMPSTLAGAQIGSFILIIFPPNNLNSAGAIDCNTWFVKSQKRNLDSQERKQSHKACRRK